jgi:hypothetical protein
LCGCTVRPASLSKQTKLTSFMRICVNMILITLNRVPRVKAIICSVLCGQTCCLTASCFHQNYKDFLIGKASLKISHSNVLREYQTSKISGFHAGYYEECRLLGYKNPVRTSQETHYVFATSTNRLIICNIRRIHGGDYEECRLMGHNNPVRT